MDALVHQRQLRGPELVQVVQSLMPAASIEVILDEVRNIVHKRISHDLKMANFATGLHVLAELFKKDYDTEALVDFLILDEDFPLQLRKELAVIRNAGLMNSFSKFVEAPKPRKCLGCFSCRGQKE